MDREGYKIVLIGDSGVGKSSLVHWFIHNKPMTTETVPTIGAAFSIKTVAIGDKNVRFNIWDSAGQERYRSLVRLYYRNTNGCICVFDISNRKTFDNVDYWVNDYRNNANYESNIVLVANKCDLNQSLWKVSEKEINETANKYSCEYLLTSCITGQNVMEAFIKVVDIISKGDGMEISNTNKEDSKIILEEKSFSKLDNCRC